MDDFHRPIVLSAYSCTASQRLQYTPAPDAASIPIAIRGINTTSCQAEDGPSAALSGTSDALRT